MTSKQGARSAPGRPRQRQKTLWWNVQSLPVALAADTVSNIDLTPQASIPGAVRGGFTCRRMLLTLNLRPVNTNVELQGSYGVTVAPLAGLAALPNPIVDLVDWYVQHSYYSFRTTAESYLEKSFDIRTSRKVRGEDRSLFFTIRSTVTSGGTMAYTISARLLLGYP